MIELMAMAAGDSGTNPTQIIAWIIIPVVIFLAGALVAAVKGVIAFTRYLVESKESQTAIAKSTDSMDKRLQEYTQKTDKRLGHVEEDVAILKYAVHAHGSNSHGGEKDER